MYLYEKFDKETTKWIIDSMDIKGSIILLYSKTHSDDTVLDQVEKWYKTKYTSKKINEDLVVRARAASYEGMH